MHIPLESTRRHAAAPLWGLALFFGAASAFAGGGPGTTAITSLKFDMGPRPSSMAGAYTAVAEGNYGPWYNPAGLGLMKNMELAGSYKNNVQDTQNQYFGILLPIPVVGLAGNEKPSVAFSYYSSKNGNMEWNKLNSDGSAAFTGRKISAGGDSVYMFSYGENVLTHDFTMIKGLSLRHNLGISAKIIRTELPAPDGSMPSNTAFAADLGYLVLIPESGTRFGLSAMNVGGSVKYIAVSDPLPLTIRAGLAQKFSITDYSLLLSADMLSYVYEQLNRARLGFELGLNMLYVRGGYKFMQDSSEVTFGGGVRFMNFSFDLGFENGNELGSSFQAGLSYRFGKEDSKDNKNKPVRAPIARPAVNKNEKLPAAPAASAQQPAPSQSQEEIIVPLEDAPPGQPPAPGTMSAPDATPHKPGNKRHPKQQTPQEELYVPDMIVID